MAGEAGAFDEAVLHGPPWFDEVQRDAFASAHSASASAMNSSKKEIRLASSFSRRGNDTACDRGFAGAALKAKRIVATERLNFADILKALAVRGRTPTIDFEWGEIPLQSGRTHCIYELVSARNSLRFVCDAHFSYFARLVHYEQRFNFLRWRACRQLVRWVDRCRLFDKRPTTQGIARFHCVVGAIRRSVFSP